MKNCYYTHFIIISIIIFFPLFSQAQTWEWVNSLGGSSADFSTNLVKDDTSNLYVAGYFRDTVNINGTDYISQGQEDGLILKLDSFGNVLMVKQITGTGSIKPRKIEIDNNNNILLLGTFEGVVSFGSLSLSASGTDTNFFITKFDNAGNDLWRERIVHTFDYDAISFDGVGLDVDINNNIYIGGTFETSVTVGTLSISDFQKSYLTKLSPTGNVLWLVKIGNTGFSPNVYVTDVAVDPTGSFVYSAGYKYQIVCFGCQTNGIQDLSLTVYKHNTNGVFNTSFASDDNVAPLSFGKIGANIAVDSNAVYVAGEFISNISFGNTTLTNSGNSVGTTSSKEGVIAKYANNAWQWATLVGGPSNQDIKDLDLNSDGDIFITGTFEGGISLGNISLQTLGQEMFLAQFDNNGIFQLAKKAGNGTGDVGQGIVADDDGDIFVSGGFFANGIFDNDTLTSVGSSDIFVAKLACIPAPIDGISGDTVSCLETKSYAIINPPGPLVSYNWTLSGGGTLIANSNTAAITWTSTGIHTLTATPVNECGQGSPFSLQIRVLDIPQQPTINGDPNACIGSSTYNVVNVFGETYAWSLTGGGNLFPLGNTAIVNWGVTGNHTLSVIPTNICGIGQTAFSTIDVKQIPSQPSPIVGNNNVCLSTQTYSITNVSDVNYSWSLSSGGTITSNGNTTTINWTTAGSHTLTVTPDNNCGFGSSRSITVIVNDVPSQPSTLVGNLTTCVGTENYSVVGVANTNYNWTLSGGGIISNLGASATITWTTPGIYTLNITPSNICGNGTPRTVTVNVEDIPSQPSPILGLDTVCLGSQIYTITQQPSINYTWSLSGGGTIIPSANSATINWTTSGTHTVTVTPYNNCGTGNSRSILVFVKNVNPQFTTITGSDTVCQGVSSYSVPNINGLNYNWTLSGGGNLTAVGNSAFVDWTSTGLYTLTVATSDGCNNSLTVDAKDVPNQPNTITGDTSVCLGISNYSILPENDVSYIWTLSGGGALTQSNFASSIDWTSTGNYTLSIIPSNICGNGVAQTINIQSNAIPTAPNSITGDTLVCLGNTAYSVPINNNVNYNWSLQNSGATISNTGNTATINWLSTTNNILSVTASNICGTSPITDLAIEVIDLPATPSISGDTSVCLNNETYSIFTEEYASYNWNLSSGGILNINNDTATINWTTTGLHQLSVTPSNQCGTGMSTNIFINTQDIPIAPTSLIGDTIVCQGIRSYSVPNTANVNYAWSLSGGGSIVAVGNSATINWTTAGTHTLIITPSNECGTGLPISKTIQVVGIPNQPTPISGNSTVCLNTETYTVTNDPNANYNWILSGGGTLTPNGNSAQINWTTPGIYTLTVAPSSICGTSTPRSITITVSDLPAIPQLNVGDTVVCLGTQLYSINPVSGVSYNWSLSGGGTLNATGTSASINWTTSGNETVTITPTNSCGTGTSLVIPVEVNSIPNQITTIGGDTSLCLSVETYSISTVNGETYNWALSSGGNLSAFSDSAIVNWFTTGTHTLSVTPSNSCGVGPSTNLIINVQDVPSQPTSIQGDILACENQPLVYQVNAINDVIYNWSLNGGGTIINNINNQATVNWTTAGNYTLSVIPSNSCGTGIAQSLNIEVRESNLTTSSIDGDTLICNGDELFYSVEFDNNLTYEWILSGNGTFTQINNSIVVEWEEAGNATILVVPSSVCGTGDTTSLDVRIENPLTIPSIIASGDSLIASTTEGLTWYLDNEIIPITTNYLIPQLEGVYTITAENVCGETGFSQPFIIGGNESGLYVYPNPASRRVTLHYPVYLRWYYFDIIDYSGRVVRETQSYNGTNEVDINISKLDSGMYLVRSYTELGYFYTKLIVQN